jgi:hypothetical protein
MKTSGSFIESKPLDHKLIFKRKMKISGTIDKYKARFVIK